MLSRTIWKKYKMGPLVILAGGMGSRLWPLTKTIYKGLIQLGRQSILELNLTRSYLFGAHEVLLMTDSHDSLFESWAKNANERIKITIVRTKSNSIREKISRALDKTSQTICVTYGDTFAPVNFDQLFKVHKESRTLVTLTVANYSLPFGVAETSDGTHVSKFIEKPQTGFKINIGYIVIKQEAKDFITNAHSFEKALDNLALAKELSLFSHRGYFECLGGFQDLKET